MSTEVEQQQQQQPKKQHLEWRRSRVLELSSQGRTEREIAQILKVGTGTVHRDVVNLNKQAQDNLKTHVQEYLPEQYQKCINGLNQVLKVGWNIVNNDSNSASNRLQGLSLINDCYMFLMDVEVITSPFTSNFESVGQYFQSFEPIQDEKVIQIMRDRNLFL